MSLHSVCQRHKACCHFLYCETSCYYISSYTICPIVVEAVVRELSIRFRGRSLWCLNCDLRHVQSPSLTGNVFVHVFLFDIHDITNSATAEHCVILCLCVVFMHTFTHTKTQIHRNLWIDPLTRHWNNAPCFYQHSRRTRPSFNPSQGCFILKTHKTRRILESKHEMTKDLENALVTALAVAIFLYIPTNSFTFFVLAKPK